MKANTLHTIRGQYGLFKMSFLITYYIKMMKNTQEQLKLSFYKELETTSTWRNSEYMINAIKKDLAYVVPLHDGWMLIIDKPKIETSFCFGYSDSCYDDSDYKRAQGAAEYARTQQDYFINENLEGINKTIEALQNAIDSENLRTRHCENYYILKHHWNWDQDDCKIRGFDILDKYEAKAENARRQMNWNELEQMTKEDLENWLEGLQIVKAQFIKRLNTYLKRFWLSKLNVWTYWRDA